MKGTIFVGDKLVRYSEPANNVLVDKGGDLLSRYVD